MKVYCGTKEPTSFEIDLSEYDYLGATGASDDAIKRAEDLLQKTLSKGRSFAAAGHRNNNAVDACIALHVLGFDPVVWFENFFETHAEKFNQKDVDIFMEHVERVTGYCNSWGPSNNEGQALNFAFN